MDKEEKVNSDQKLEQLKKRIADLEEEKQSLEQIIAMMPGHIYWKNRKGELMGCNDQQALDAGLKSRYDIVGLKPIDLINKNQAETVRQEQAKKIEAADLEVMNNGLPINLEETAVLEDGSTGFFISNKKPLFDQAGQVNGIIGVTLDITEKKRLEKNLRKAEAQFAAEKARVTSMQALAGSIAHDMRTPLAAINSAAGGVSKFLPRLVDAYKMAQDANLDVPLIRKDHICILGEVMNHINQEAAFALSLISSTLDSVKEGELNTQSFENITMSECVREALGMYGYKNPDDKEKVHFNEGNDFTFWGGKNEMMNLLFNLMKNAYHFIAKAQKGEITIWLENKDDHNELHFKDTGPGMSAEVRQHLFEPFFTQREGGTGLGLNFCNKAMRAFKGSISADSKEGEFTEFVMVFPKVLI